MDANSRNPVKRKILLGMLLYIGVLLLLTALLLAAAAFLPSKRAAAPDELAFSRLINSGQTQYVSSTDLIPAWSPTLGPKDAPITIVEFGDFQCPYCQASFEPMKRILSLYPDKIRFVYRHFPLQSIHPLARDLAQASMCANEQGKFWAFHDRLFQYQDEITSENIEEQAIAAGVKGESFRQCRSSQRWYDEIDKDFSDAVARGGQGTPTWIVNDQRLQGYLTEETWKHIVDSLLSQ